MYLFMPVSRFLFTVIFGSESEWLGLGNQESGMGGLAKTNLTRSWHSHDVRVHLSCFRVALGTIFITFVVLETSWNFDDFSR